MKIADLAIAKSVLQQEAAAILNAADLLDENFEQAIEWILGSKGRVITCGVGKSGHIARKTAGTLSSTGTPSLFLHAAEAVHGDLGMVTAGDIVLMYTHSGETDELVSLFPPIRAIGAKIILISGRRDSSAGRQADLVLETHVTEEACPNNLAPTTSTTVMLALSDALAIAVMTRRHFSREDFAKFHPSGALGKRLLLRVSDVMRPVGEIAEVSPSTPILDIMKAITQAGVGAACVVTPSHNLLGLVTEGDLRRALVQKNDLNQTAESIMTRAAATLTSDLLAVEALEAFQNYPKPIGEMPVVDETRLMGLLTVKDLLRSGIV